LGRNFVRVGRADIRGRGGRNNIHLQDIRIFFPGLSDPAFAFRPFECKAVQNRKREKEDAK
jgi:hypothetical protein